MDARSIQKRAYNKLARFGTLLSIAVYLAVLVIQSAPPVYAGTLLLNRYDRISDSATGAVATHAIGFTYADFSTAIGSVSMQFCSNDPVIGAPCTAPVGFDATGVVLATQTGETGFSIHPSSTANNIILTRALTVPTVGPSQYDFTGVVNPSAVGTYYIRLSTHAANNGTGLTVEEGGVAISANGPLNVVSEVPPFLRFCVSVTIVAFDCSSATSFFIDLGELLANQTKFASAQMMAVTNAQSGYTVSISGTTLTSGNNIIPASATPTASNVGTSQFGINLRSNSNPSIGADPVGPGTAVPTANYNTPNLFKFQQGDAVASGGVSQDYRKYTISYLANISPSQAAGVYATTITFICMANF